MREEVLLEQFGDMLDGVTLSSEMFEWLRAALRESFAHVHKEHDDAVSRLQTERERLRERLKQIYMDNLDGRIEDEVYNALTVQFRDQERKVAKELERRHDADLSYFDDGIALLSVARDSKQRFLSADLAAKKHVLSAVLSNCSFRDRQLSAEYRQPFDILVEKSPGGDAAGKRTRRKKGESPQWQGIVYDIRTSLWEDADTIAASVLSLRLIGYLPQAGGGG